MGFSGYLTNQEITDLTAARSRAGFSMYHAGYY